MIKRKSVPVPKYETTLTIKVGAIERTLAPGDQFIATFTRKLDDGGAIISQHTLFLTLKDGGDSNQWVLLPELVARIARRVFRP